MAEIKSVPFYKVDCVSDEEKLLLQALHSGKWCGRGAKTLELEKFINSFLGVKHSFFVTSCTSALEMSCLLAGVGPGDEVILPSFGFVSAANAVVLRGATPVFADVDLNTWNLSSETVLPHINSKTKAILTVHYAGSSAGIEELRELCSDNKLFLIEDAAQSLGAKRSGKYIGSTQWTTSFSLHETKNISCGEGGLICTDSDELASQIEIIIEKGTNRQKFLKGQVDKYTWVDLGSSYIASDLLAAVALAQVKKTDDISQKRMSICHRYREELGVFGEKLHWQQVPKDVEVNGHIAVFRVDVKKRDGVLKELRELGVGATFHYVPLHTAPFYTENFKAQKSHLKNTDLVSYGLIRLPLYYSMTQNEVAFVVEKTKKVLTKHL